MINSYKIAAIYTTFNPGSGFGTRICDVVKCCAVTIVVDNTPGGFSFRADDIGGIILLQDGRNKGLGAAINIGINEAVRQGCNVVVLFDQDSSPRSDFISVLLNQLSTMDPRSIIGPTLLDDENILTETISPFSSQSIVLREEVTCIATSGMCFRVDSLELHDRFTEDFFLDFVDFDWCWRMRSKGWRVFRLTSLKMPHRLGLGQRRLLGLTYHIPSPFRHYFQFRDTLKLIKLSYVPLYSRLRLLAILPPKIIVYPFLLDHGLERLKWMLKGVRDAFFNVQGIGAATAKLEGKIDIKT